MLQAQSPLNLDTQNASWSAKQASQLPLTGQELENVNKWYLSYELNHGLVVPILAEDHIVLDSIDRVDNEKHRFRTNAHGWYYLDSTTENTRGRLLKPNRRVMTAACTGHTWMNNNKTNPTIPSLRELLLSCAINWRNFKQTTSFS